MYYYKSMEDPKDIHPPKFAQRFLQWFCSDAYLESVEGDLYEEFLDNAEEKGLRKAQRIYIKTVFLSFRLYQIRKPQNKTFITMAMLLNYFKIAYRSLLKHKSYSIINVFGLSFGIACFLIISLYIKDELAFDKLHLEHEYIYRVTETLVNEKGEKHQPSVAFQASQRLLTEFPEVQRGITLFNNGRTLASNPDNQYSTYLELNYTTPAFFEIFDFKLLSGDRQNLLKKPQAIVLDEKTAIQLFGSTDVVGKTVHSDRTKHPYKVTGVMENFPKNSHLQLNSLISFATLEEERFFKEFAPVDWTSNYFASYVLLNRNANSTHVEEGLNSLAQANREASSLKRSYHLQPLDDIHFGSAHYENDYSFNPNDINYMYIMQVAGVLILLIAAFNYMNLATARSMARSKEIGIRKVAGAFRSSIVIQFLVESILMTSICVFVASGIVNLVLPYFNYFTGKEISINPIEHIWVIPSLFLLTLVMGIISGLYPAVFLSRFQAATVLKSAGNKVNANMGLRRVLVTFQFVVSIILSVATLVTYLQMQYIDKKDLGFNKELMLVADINSGVVRRDFQTLKNEYAKIPGVKSVSVSSRVPGEWKRIPKTLLTNEVQTKEQGNEMFFLGVDEDFVSTFDVKLQSGMNFEGNTNDSTRVLINEIAAKLLGISNAEGQLVKMHYSNFGGNIDQFDEPLEVTVVGIVKDFHYRSLHEDIAPLVLAYRNNPIHSIDYFTMQINGSNIARTLDSIEEVLQSVDPQHIFEFHFLDEQLALFYESDERRSLIFTVSASISVAIACLGLIALVSFSTRQKQKEIGIRKVHGASVWSITYMLSKEFFVLILIALLISAPLAWYGMGNWLNTFAYHISMSPLYILATGLFMMILTLLSVGFQSLKAANKNPVDTLRSE
ncbi:FtsX-like permease family protein [Flammeovirgaceae bacterium SG7u.111]|nr:FtsX-like permease family protein [Flammeovirgaceae bacterium SG7u.132]WPO37810.1 FtsX-like permease family protein [Flammeovirgaceae bacterium SG7u.111]